MCAHAHLWIGVLVMSIRASASNELSAAVSIWFPLVFLRRCHSLTTRRPILLALSDDLDVHPEQLVAQDENLALVRLDRHKRGEGRSPPASLLL